MIFSQAYYYVFERGHVVKRHIQGVSRLVEITAGGDFIGFCGQKS
jgi:hypothetical protein